MSDRQDAVAYIIALMRDYSNTCNDGYLTDYGVVCADMRNYADRLEAALKQEKATAENSSAVGNAAKLREALDEIRVDAMADYGQDADYLIEKCNAALAAPPRNCDRFKTKEEAAIAFANEKKLWIPQQVLWKLAPWLDWLFATAKEGETK